MKDYNPEALRGEPITDEEFISNWNSNALTSAPLEDALAHTKELPMRIIDIRIAENLKEGSIDEKEAAKLRSQKVNQLNKTLASLGLLK